MEQTTASFADRVDLLIAATALVHGLCVVTRNVRHFEPTGVRVLNPFEDAEETENSPEGV